LGVDLRGERKAERREAAPVGRKEEEVRAAAAATGEADADCDDGSGGGGGGGVVTEPPAELELKAGLPFFGGGGGGPGDRGAEDVSAVAVVSWARSLASSSS